MFCLSRQQRLDPEVSNLALLHFECKESSFLHLAIYILRFHLEEKLHELYENLSEPTEMQTLYRYSHLRTVCLNTRSAANLTVIIRESNFVFKL